MYITSEIEISQFSN